MRGGLGPACLREMGLIRLEALTQLVERERTDLPLEDIVFLCTLESSFLAFHLLISLQHVGLYVACLQQIQSSVNNVEKKELIVSKNTFRGITHLLEDKRTEKTLKHV